MVIKEVKTGKFLQLHAEVKNYQHYGENSLQSLPFFIASLSYVASVFWIQKLSVQKNAFLSVILLVVFLVVYIIELKLQKTYRRRRINIIDMNLNEG